MQHLLWCVPCFEDWMTISMIPSTSMAKLSAITHITVPHRIQRKKGKGAENALTSIHGIRWNRYLENRFNMYNWIFKFKCASHNIAKSHLPFTRGKRIIRPRTRNKHAMIFKQWLFQSYWCGNVLGKHGISFSEGAQVLERNVVLFMQMWSLKHTVNKWTNTCPILPLSQNNCPVICLARNWGSRSNIFAQNHLYQEVFRHRNFRECFGVVVVFVFEESYL